MRGLRRLGTARDAGLLGLVVLMLARGVGGTTAVFTVVDVLGRTLRIDEELDVLASPALVL